MLLLINDSPEDVMETDPSLELLRKLWNGWKWLRKFLASTNVCSRL